MLRKRWCSTPARLRPGKAWPCSSPIPACNLRRCCSSSPAGCWSRHWSASARLAFSSERPSSADPRLAAHSVYECTLVRVDCGRISTHYARSSVTYDSHDEAPSVDDGCCSAHSRRSTRVPLLCGFPKLFIKSDASLAGLPARWLNAVFGLPLVLAGWHGGRNWMASAVCVSVRHAFPGDASFGGRFFSGGWPPILAPYCAIFAE